MSKRKQEERHRENLLRNVQRMQMLEELHRWWEPRKYQDPEYFNGLCDRLRRIKNRVRVMKP